VFTFLYDNIWEFTCFYYNIREFTCLLVKEESGQSRKNHDLNSSKKSKASALRAILLRKVFLCLEGSAYLEKDPNLVMNSKELRMPWLGPTTNGAKSGED
jgi:hypothetical protein